MSNEPQEIKDRLSVVEVVSEYVELKKAGQNHKAPCPFHNEKSPSFVVSEEKQIWHCFGCSKGGDIFTFIEEMEGVDFKKALEILAKKAGIELKKTDPAKISKNQRVLEVLTLANDFFRQGLLKSKSGEAARKYLEGRNVPDDIAEMTSIGYSPDSFSILSSFLLKRGYTQKEIAEAGLAVLKPDSSRYDRFRNRLMFPIYTVQDFVVGFGARILEKNDKAPKYINSPETQYYNKSRILYGLNWAKNEARLKKFIIVVEGYLDVVASHKAGVKNVVASSGTALTTEQVQLMNRFVDSVYLSFDMDSAGEQATKRGVEKLLAAGLDIKIITLPGGKDPDELINDDPKLWVKAVEEAQPLLDHYFKKSFSELDYSDPKQKSEVFKDLSGLISHIPNAIERAHYIKRLAESLDIPENIIRSEMPKSQLQKKAETPVHMRNSKGSLKKVKKERNPHIENTKHVFAMLMMFPELVGETPEFAFEKTGDKTLDMLASLLKKVYNEGQHESVYFFKLVEKTDPERAKDAKQIILLFEHEVLSSSQDVALADIRPIFNKGLAHLKRFSLKQKLQELSKDMRRAEHEQRFSDVEKLNELFNVLTNELRQI